MFYYLKRILYKIPKKLLVYLLIFIIIMLFTTSSHASQIDVNNLPNADVRASIEETYRQDFYKLLYSSIKYAKNNNNTFHSTFVYFCNCVTVNSSRFYWYVSSQYGNSFFLNNNKAPLVTDTSNRVFFGVAPNDAVSYNYDDYFVFPGSRNTNTALSKQWALGEPSAITYRLNYCTSPNNATVNYTNNLQGYLYIPAGFENYCPSDLYDTIYSIALGTFDFSSSEQILAEISEKIDQTNDQLEQMNDFFNSDTTPTVTDNDLPSDNMNDITRDGFNGIFTKLFDATNTNTVETVSIPIPFLNYSFTVSSNYLENIIRGWEIYLPNSVDASILTLIYIIWRFIIYRYIVLDIYKYINDFKNGNISKTDTNIKADML